MPPIAHNHDFAATAGGYRCLISPCTVAVTDAEIASNIETHSPGKGQSVTLNLNDVLNRASKKSGKS